VIESYCNLEEASVVGSGEGEQYGSDWVEVFLSPPRRIFESWPLRLRATSMVCVIGLCIVLLSVPTLARAAAPQVVEESALAVKATSVTLRAKVNPGGELATYRFEYATSEATLLLSNGEVFPVPPSPEGEAGPGEGVVVEGGLQGLTPGTKYWYRVVVKNGEGVTPGCQTKESCQSFTTPPAGRELELPDRRAWELVSPAPGRDGATASVTPISRGGALIQAGEDGGAITYGTIGSVGVEPAGNTNYSQVLSFRDPNGGWSSRDIATPHERATGVLAGEGQEYRFFSRDLSIGLVEPLGPRVGAASLSPGASEKTVYLRADAPFSPAGEGIYSETVTEGSYLPLVTGCPSSLVEKCKASVEEYANVPPGTKVGGAIHFVGATDDLGHVVLSSGVPLTRTTPEGAETEGEGLYEWSDGRLQLVSLLPEHGQASGGNAVLGYDDADARNAISRDGSRIVWSNRAEGEEHLYMRDTSSEKSVQLDENQGGRGGEPSPEFQFANSEGTKVFFTDTEDLTAKSTATEGEPDLYECEVVEAPSGELSCALQDLTIDSGGHADVRGAVLAGSNDSSHIYFVAQGKLTSSKNQRGEEAEAEANNLYMLLYDEEKEEWKAPVFIVALSSADSPDWEAVDGNLEKVTSSVSPDGGYLEFMSEGALTGYDNVDANSDAADEEVFLYNARSNRLVCASCNPTYGRPDGVRDSLQVNIGSGLLIDKQDIWANHRWLAANVPGWTGSSLGVAAYQSRYLSDEGRLFFNSSDGLVPQATNGLADVYEYEPLRVGGCEESSVSFSEDSEGCVELISSGSSGEESAFLDASKSGDDVFFLSSARLTPEDTGSALAVYDAHVCSAASPCLVEAVVPPACVTEASCKAAPSPQPSIFGASGSATFKGAGNLVPSSSTTVTTKKITTCSKHKKLSHGKCVRIKRKAGAKRVGDGRRAGR
jgi:hypothetical protein